MGGRRLRSSSYAALFFFVIFFMATSLPSEMGGGMKMVAEGRTCESQSNAFKGACLSDTNCGGRRRGSRSENQSEGDDWGVLEGEWNEYSYSEKYKFTTFKEEKLPLDSRVQMIPNSSEFIVNRNCCLAGPGRAGPLEVEARQKKRIRYRN
ncbi:hypothetical protein DM860_016432 [Cuscuta australis]|uniref:Uncharacterized protein n=1 Tax=Cuscuta australis TaxID=267555 RepID=A0A328DFE1_9ASTE|nr:hypothetical protein DM860_016432 [Cuscuta australis]